MKIIDLEHLKKLCEGKSQLDCFVALNGCRSSKTLILYADKSVTVFEEIDGSAEEFDSLDDMNNKHEVIREALEKNAFHVFDYEVKAK